ncbi:MULTISPECIES: hypothetical protein [unclassified Pseudomonas]|uniref:hypothetical protein n=1 Tax=unclassified Pseudomonas TaxID=196821 RepID=UPI001CC017C3|nr:MULTISPECIES: hypothetical protein [unclassified Pseudomonas]
MDIEGVRKISNWIVNKNILLQAEIFRNIRAAFTTTVYAFLNPRRPSAAWDFFCLKIETAMAPFMGVGRATGQAGFLSIPIS